MKAAFLFFLVLQHNNQSIFGVSSIDKATVVDVATIVPTGFERFLFFPETRFNGESRSWCLKHPPREARTGRNCTKYQKCCFYFESNCNGNQGVLTFDGVGGVEGGGCRDRGERSRMMRGAVSAARTPQHTKSR